MSKNDTAVNDEAVQQDAATADPAPAENNSPEVSGDDAFTQGLNDESIDPDAEAETDSQDSDDSSDDSDEEAEDTADKKAEETEADAKTQGEKPSTTDDGKADWDSLKGTSQERFRQKANEAKELREQLAQVQSRETQVAAEQKLMNEINPETGDYYTPQEAERAARTYSNQQTQQRLAQERYELEVQQNQQTLASEAQEVVSQYPMFDSKSPEYRPDLAERAEALVRQSLIVDDNGTIIGSQISPKQIYQSIADSAQAAAAKQQAEAQKATEKMLANADVPSGSSQAQKEDPFLSGLNEDPDY